MMKRRLCGVGALLASLFAQSTIVGQTARIAVNCKSERLNSAERETCASPILLRLTADVDQRTEQLETKLIGRYKEVLVDTARPFMVQRNGCLNDRSSVHDCVDRVLRRRLDALIAASTSPTSILDEIAQYTALDIRYFQKYGDLLIGKRVRIFGCMSLDPGESPSSRIYGAIGESCSKTNGAYVPVIFTSMNETRAIWFYDAKTPHSYWEGVVERRDGRLVLAQVEP